MLCCKNMEKPGSQQKTVVQISWLFITPIFTTLIKQQERKEDRPHSFQKFAVLLFSLQKLWFYSNWSNNGCKRISITAPFFHTIVPFGRLPFGEWNFLCGVAVRCTGNKTCLWIWARLEKYIFELLYFFIFLTSTQTVCIQHNV